MPLLLRPWLEQTLHRRTQGVEEQGLLAIKDTVVANRDHRLDTRILHKTLV
jgi:hypothetical protein